MRAYSRTRNIQHYTYIYGYMDDDDDGEKQHSGKPRKCENVNAQTTKMENV